MPLQFILGKPGTGKTTRCLQEINARLDGAAPLYYLVPEQFSLQSERLLLSQRDAATQVQVLSFNRLAYRLFATFGGAPSKLADDLGKQMLLRKVLFEVADNLTYYKNAADKHGFVDALSHTITEMNQYCVTGQDLLLRTPEAAPAAKAKLTDIATIYGAYRQLVAGRYLLTDDMLDLLNAKLDTMQRENAPFPLLDGAYFWVDGFSGFTPQERQVLKHIMKRANHVTVTLTTDLQAPSFSPPQITMEKLTALVKDNHIPIMPPVLLDTDYRHKDTPELQHFVQNFTILPTKVTTPFAGCANSSDAIQIVAAPDRYAAVNTAAANILDWVQKGYRFRDIAILCGDRAHYEKVLQTTFDRLNIPLFVDTETDILSHPLTELIRSALDMVVRHWNYESVLRFLKTRMTGLPLETVDVLENYVLAHGITGFRWRYHFANPVAEAARVTLLDTLATFTQTKNQPNAKDTVQNHCRRVFDMLYALNVPETLQNWYDSAMETGDLAVAKMHMQIWPKICEVFDKLVEMLGDEEVTVKTFAATLDAGFKQVGLGRVPPTTDQVILGDIGRSRYPKIKAMIVLGANENVLPPIPGATGLFTDYERLTLRNTGVELASESMHRMAESYYSLYCALCQPKERLMLIYSEAETSGKALRPSPIIGRIQAMFPGLQVQNAPEISEYGKVSPPQPRLTTLSETSLQRIYGDHVTTAASRLESFARCPFAYFMTYILQAKPRKRFEVLPTDLGSLFHDVLAQFSRRYWENGSHQHPGREAIVAAVNEMVDTITEASAIYQDTARNRHVLNKVRRVSTASIWALCEHLKLGEYTPTAAEEQILTKDKIVLDNGKKLSLTGIVDRVDVLEAGGETYVKIIDYKSGATKFNLDEVRQGIQLQLMLYMNVILAQRGAKPGGMFYFPIDDPILSTDIVLSDEMREAGLLKQFKMSGVALAEDAVMAGLDKTLAPGVSSDVIPVGKNKDGRFSKASQGATLGLDEFLALGQEVDAVIKNLGQRMTCGDISAVPYTKGAKSPCQFCGYGAICRKKG